MWSQTAGDARVCIAILDGPVCRDHPCFQDAKLTQVETTVDSNSASNWARRHGTHVASIIFGRHGSSVWGAAPQCSGLIIPIFGNNAGEARTCSQLDLARAIDLAVVNGAHIINISGGQLIDAGAIDPLLEQAIQRSASKALIVAAAGNDGCQCLHVPAAVSSVLAVGAVDSNGAALEFSNWGDGYQQHGLVAPGENIPGATPEKTTTTNSGTSYATAIVSGVAGLLLGMQLKRGEDLNPAFIKDVLLETADRCELDDEEYCQRLLLGRLNINAAMTRINQEKSRYKTFGGSRNLSVDLGVHSELATASAILLRNIQPDSESQKSSLLLSVDADTEKVFGNLIELRSKLPPSKEAILSIEPSATMNTVVSTLIKDPLLEMAVDSEQSNANISIPFQAAGVQSGIAPSDCGCGGKSSPPALVYALGRIGYDFMAETRRDSFLQQSGLDLQDPAKWLAYLDTDPASATGVVWTLSVDATVVYAVAPFGAYAAVGYERLREFMLGQLEGTVERVSVPGRTAGTVRLLSGQTVPVIFPEIRGMYSWCTSALLADVKDDAAKQAISNFLERIYYESRNLGLTPGERAQNYAATNAFQLEFVYRDSMRDGLRLDSIDVESSPICRPGSDCRDVKLTFFHPTKRQEVARRVYRFTIDVSDVIPVTVGQVRRWEIG